MRAFAALGSLVWVCLLTAPGLNAQVLSGTVFDRATLGPVEGALVQLVGDDSEVHASVLSGLQGRYAVSFPGGGPYRVRIRRIGYATQTSEPVDLPTTRLGPFDIGIDVEAISLEPIVATGSGRCIVDPRTGEQTAILWDLARRVLDVTALINREALLEYRLLRFTRDLDPSRTVLQNEALNQSVITRPFHSLPSAILAASGYVQAAGDETAFYMPDPEVVLSESFLSRHCFHVAVQEGPQGRLVGLAFRPLDRQGPPDVEGVLWLDGTSSELRYMDYAYTGLPEVVADAAGGKAEFEQLATGAWVVRRWWITMPRLGERKRLLGLSSEQVLLGIIEEGGEILAALDPAGSVVTRTGEQELVGRLWDLDRPVPLAGARVSLSGTDRETQSDAEGWFRFSDLTPGEYFVTFGHPVLDTMVVYPPVRAVRVPQSGEPVVLTAPRRSQLLDDVCEDVSLTAVAGVVSGQVLGPDGTPVVDAWVTLELPDGRGDARAETDELGLFRFCGVPVGRVRVRAEQGDNKSRELDATVRLRDFTRVDIVVGGAGG